MQVEVHPVGQSKLNFLVKEIRNCLVVSSNFPILLGDVVQYGTLSQIFSTPSFRMVNPCFTIKLRICVEQRK